MKRLVIILGIVVILLVVSYVIFALVEGERQFEYDIKEEDVVTLEGSAQKLLVGDYFVYVSKESTPDGGSKIRIWRLLVGGERAEEITNFLADSEEYQFFKFSEESLAVWQGENKELWHINGDLIGPAESTRSLISPDRRWLVSVNAASKEPVIILQSISTGAQSEWLVSDYLSQGYLVPRLWSDDSRLIYLTAKGESGADLPGFWVLDLSREQVIEFAEVAVNNISDITVYPDLKQAIGTNDDLPSQIMLIDLETGVIDELISNKDYKFKSPKLSANGRNFSFTLLSQDLSVWQANFINPQIKQEKMVVSGRLLAWPQDDTWLIYESGSLQVYNSLTGETINLVIGDGKNVGWEFIDIFNIK